MFAVRGLVAAGRTYDNSYAIRKACNFLLSKQQSTGGWGESFLSSETGVRNVSFLREEELCPKFINQFS
jgi:achilleol B synthase